MIVSIFSFGGIKLSSLNNWKKRDRWRQMNFEKLFHVNIVCVYKYSVLVIVLQSRITSDRRMLYTLYNLGKLNL